MMSATFSDATAPGLTELSPCMVTFNSSRFFTTPSVDPNRPALLRPEGLMYILLMECPLPSKVALNEASATKTVWPICSQPSPLFQ